MIPDVLPARWIRPGPSRRLALQVFGVTTAVFFGVELLLDLRLQAEGSGIIDFELAPSSERAAEIISGWGDETTTARLQLWLDYPFLIAAAVFFSLAVLATGDGLRASSKLRALAPVFAALPLFAGLADAVENTALLVAISGGSVSDPPVAFCAALVKYACGFAAIAYIGAALTIKAAVRHRA